MNIVDEIKNRYPLAEYIEKATGLQFKPVGTWQSLPECPFCGGHDCARYNPNSKTFHCFQCAVFCGNAIHFRSQFEHITFKDAVEKFAVELGLKKYDKKEVDWILLRETAADFMKETLFSSQISYQFRGQEITPLAYLTETRKHSIEAILNFRIGFNDGKLIEHLESKFPKEIVKASGLSYIGDGCFAYPYFVGGEIKYFRVKDPNKIKKFQMPSAARSRFAIWYNQDSLKEGVEIWLVEGEDDVVSLWDCGVSAVASCGSLSMEQIDFLKSKNPQCVYSSFDSDAAGQKNTETLTRNLPIENLFIVKIEGAKDVDELIRKFEGEDKGTLITELKQNCAAPSPEMKTKIIQKSDGYYVEKGEDRHLVQISNWTIFISAIIYSDANETAQWRCKLSAGKTEKDITVPMDAFAHPSALQRFMLNQGKILYFLGTDYDLSQLLSYFSVVMKPKNVMEISYAGETKYGFIAENVFISHSGEIKPLTNGYLTIDDQTSVHVTPLVKRGGSVSEMPNFSLAEPVGGIREYEKYVCQLLVKNRNLKSLLAIGWARATLWSGMFYERKRYFPILVLHGKFQSGKSVLANWIMSMLGLRGCNPEMLSDRGTSEVGLGRKLSYYSSLPVFIEDYRSDETGQRFHTFLRGCFDRTSATKGIKDDFGVRRVVIRGCVLLTGEHAPGDPALFSRCIPLELTRAERKDKFFKEACKLEPGFSAIGFDWLKRRNAEFAGFMETFDRLEGLLQKELNDPRQGSCFAVALAGAGGWAKEDDLLDFAVKLSKFEAEEARREESINQIWECLDILYRKGQTDQHEVSLDSSAAEIAINLPSLMAKIRGGQWTRAYTFPTNRELAKLLKQEDYVRGYHSWRVDGRVSWRWVVDLNAAPPLLRDTFLEPKDEKTNEQDDLL